MKVSYSLSSSAVYVQLQNSNIKSSQKIGEGVVVDFDKDGKVIGIDIMIADKEFTLEVCK